MTENITDATGRVLAVKEMDPADQLDLLEACAQNAGNSTWTGLALLVCSVTQIDDAVVPMPRNPVEVKALARRLGRAGVAAVAAHLNAQPSAEAVKEVAKN